MLKHLSISNYALIDQLELDFSNQLNIMTGETGAGKSVIIGALSLVLGERADTSVLRDTDGKCIVEASFDLKGFDFKELFKENDLDYEDITLIRREINAQGKSRAFINDTPVNLNTLKEMSGQLVDVHSQHQTLKLKDAVFRLSLLDASAQNSSLLNNYKEAYQLYAAAKRRLESLISKEAESKRDEDYFRFQFNEIEEASLKAGEEESIENELEALTHAEDIKMNLTKTVYLLNESDGNIIQQLEECSTLLKEVAKFSEQYKSLKDRIESVLIEIKDINREADIEQEGLQHDPERITELSQRLDTINHLMSKHHVSKVEELIGLREEFDQKLQEIDSYTDEIENLGRQVTTHLKKAREISEQLSIKRKEVAKQLEKRVEEILQILGMPNATFKLDIEQAEELTPNGLDTVDFRFTANKGEEAKDIQKVASGGELSRLMLALKSILSGMKNLPTVIFDEIDTGVSGSVADKMGNIISNMGKGMQVICITHLPQIASKGNYHLFVYKEESKDKTFTRIKPLSQDERILEIAKMLSSDKPTQAALDNARDLLVN